MTEIPQENHKYCIDCNSRLVYFTGVDKYYCWGCRIEYKESQCISLSELEKILQSKKEKEVKK